MYYVVNEDYLLPGGLLGPYIFLWRRLTEKFGRTPGFKFKCIYKAIKYCEKVDKTSYIHQDNSLIGYYDGKYRPYRK